MQFPSEFEWIAPNGQSLLTSYMPAHYSAGWDLERATTLEGATWRAYQLFENLAAVAAVPVTLLPVGTDYTPPSRWVSDIASTWSQRYAWPRFEVGLPAEFFAAVRQELDRQGRALSPQSRDMGPIYTGKDVSFIDTKQAQRLAEVELAEAEAMAALASVLGFPPRHRALDKAWRQLVFGAHHDGITGSESDQVYLDLLGGWREAYELAHSVATESRQVLLDAISTTGEGEALVVTNTTGIQRRDLVEVDVANSLDAGDAAVLDDAGQPVPVVHEPLEGTDGARLKFVVDAVPPVGYRTYRLVRRRHSAESAPWALAAGLTIANEHLEVVADPERGGGLATVRHRASGFELVPTGDVGNELLVYPEYPTHPRYGESTWHLIPCGASQPLAKMGRPKFTGKPRPSASDWWSRGHLEGFGYRQLVTLWRGSTASSCEPRSMAGRSPIVFSDCGSPPPSSEGRRCRPWATPSSAVGSPSLTSTPPSPRGHWTTRPPNGSAWAPTSLSTPSKTAPLPPSFGGRRRAHHANRLRRGAMGTRGGGGPGATGRDRNLLGGRRQPLRRAPRRFQSPRLPHRAGRPERQHLCRRTSR